MKIRTFAVVVAALLFTAIASPAQAMYHPGMGRFMQRDPGPGGITGSMPSRIGHAGIAAPYTDGMNLYQYVKSSPVNYVDPSGLKCFCCCARNIKIENIKQINTTTHWGHSFDTVIDLEYVEGGSAKGLTDCKFEWFEKIDLPAVTGHQANTWTNMTQLAGSAGSFQGSWGARKMPLPGKETVRDTDPPALGVRPGRNAERTLYFAIRVTSGQSEACAKACGNHAVDIKTGKIVAESMTIYATQYLTMVNGKGDKQIFTLGVDKSKARNEP